MVPELKENSKQHFKNELAESFDSLNLDSPTKTKSPVKFIKNIIISGKADMKLHFGLLKQKSSKDTIKNSVRPSTEEASKWADSFFDLMNSKYGQSLFKAFLQREFCEENLEFWLAVEDYRKSSPNKLPNKSQNIYNEFILPQSPKEINIDSTSRDNLINKMSEPPTQILFDQVQQRIKNIIESDSYARFLKSDLYLELVHPENYSTDEGS